MERGVTVVKWGVKVWAGLDVVTMRQCPSVCVSYQRMTRDHQIMSCRDADNHTTNIGANNTSVSTYTRPTQTDSSPTHTCVSIPE